MTALMHEELAEQRRQDLLRQAERVRRVRKARQARSARAGRGDTPTPWAWRAVAGRVLVRVGVLVSGTALEDSIVAIRHRRRPTTIAVIWSDRRVPHGDPPTPVCLPAGRRDRSGSRP